MYVVCLICCRLAGIKQRTNSIMNFLMLRGQIPQDRNPQEIVFDYISKVDDVWTWLFYRLSNLRTEHGSKGLK